MSTAKKSQPKNIEFKVNILKLEINGSAKDVENQTFVVSLRRHGSALSTKPTAAEFIKTDENVLNGPLYAAVFNESFTLHSTMYSNSDGTMREKIASLTVQHKDETKKPKNFVVDSELEIKLNLIYNEENEPHQLVFPFVSQSTKVSFNLTVFVEMKETSESKSMSSKILKTKSIRSAGSFTEGSSMSYGDMSEYLSKRISTPITKGDSFVTPSRESSIKDLSVLRSATNDAVEPTKEEVVPVAEDTNTEEDSEDTLQNDEPDAETEKLEPDVEKLNNPETITLSEPIPFSSPVPEPAPIVEPAPIPVTAPEPTIVPATPAPVTETKPVDNAFQTPGFSEFIPPVNNTTPAESPFVVPETPVVPVTPFEQFTPMVSKTPVNTPAVPVIHSIPSAPVVIVRTEPAVKEPLQQQQQSQQQSYSWIWGNRSIFVNALLFIFFGYFIINFGIMFIVVKYVSGFFLKRFNLFKDLVDVKISEIKRSTKSPKSQSWAGQLIDNADASSNLHRTYASTKAELPSLSVSLLFNPTALVATVIILGEHYLGRSTR